MRKFRDKRLYGRGSKIWCRVPGPDGRIVRRTTRCTDEAAASARADEFERRYADPRYAAAAQATLEGGVRALLADMRRRGRAEATLEIAAQKLGHFVRVWGKGFALVDVTASLVLAYVDTRTAEGAARFTVKKELDHLGQMLKLARYVGAFRLDPAEVLPPFFSGDHKPRTRKLTEAEATALCDALDPPRGAHVAFILATGARRSEAAKARRGDVGEAAVRLRGTKTDAAEDDVPITALSRPWLSRALASAPGADLLFAPWGNLSRDLDAACARAGIASCTPNDLRRSFASWHRDAGVSAELVSKLLRHTTDKLAQTTYARIGAKAVGLLVQSQLGGVSGLYADTGTDGPNVPLLAQENSAESGATLGNRTPDLRFTKPNVASRSDRIKSGMRRAAERASVPEAYSPKGAPAFALLVALRSALAAVHGDVRGRVLDVRS